MSIRNKVAAGVTALMLAFTPAVANAQSSTPTEPDLVASYEIEQRPEGERYHVTPTDRARAISSSEALEIEPRPEFLRKGIPATASMAGQFICHAVFTSDKPTWNLEVWRPFVSPEKYVATQCNP